MKTELKQAQPMIAKAAEILVRRGIEKPTMAQMIEAMEEANDALANLAIEMIENRTDRAKEARRILARKVYVGVNLNSLARKVAS